MLANDLRPVRQVYGSEGETLITLDGYFDFATRDAGPAQKVYQGINSLEFFVGHSMEGWYATGGRSELMKAERQASWHGTILTSGEFVQHYPVTACCWASGNENINRRGFAVEMEGMAGQPATTGQQLTAKKLRGELAAHAGRGYPHINAPGGHYTAPLPILSKPDGRFVVHSEVATWITPNAGPTACPSGRWDFMWSGVATQPQEENEMTEAEIRALVDAAIAHQFPKLLRAAVEGGFTEESAKADIAAFLGGISGTTPTAGTRFTVEVVS